MSRLKKARRIECLVGLEKEADLVDEAKNNFPNDEYHFYEVNIEDDDFEDIMQDIVLKLGIPNFNIINISMLLLHLRNPHKLLRRIHRYLSDDGILVIRDIDDGLNIGFPDANNDFDRIYDICDKNETSGVRRSGRQIPVHLQRAGYHEIQLKKAGLNTLNLDCDEREALFDTYFRFILGDIRWMHDKYPTNDTIKQDYEWYSDVFDDLAEQFLATEFFFSIGFMLFTAKK